MENLTFVYLSSYMLLISYYLQNYNIYKNFINVDFIINRYIIEEQLINLNKNLNNKYLYWSFQYMSFGIAIIMILFNLGGDYKYIYIGFSIFLFIQYIIEYYHFYIPTLIRMEKENKTAKEILDDLEKQEQKEELKLNNYQKLNINNLKTKKDKYSFLIGKESNIEYIKEKEDSIYAYNEANELYQYNLLEKKLYKIKEKDSKYFNSFYSHTNFKRIFIYELAEPIALSIIIFISFIKIT